MDYEGHIEELMHLYCRRAYYSAEAAERKSFPLPGDEVHWPRDMTFSIKHVKLELELDVDNELLKGVASHIFSPINDGLTSLELDAAELEIQSVTALDGTTLGYSHENESLRVELRSPLDQGEESTIQGSVSV